MNNFIKLFTTKKGRHIITIVLITTAIICGVLYLVIGSNFILQMSGELPERDVTKYDSNKIRERVRGVEEGIFGNNSIGDESTETGDESLEYAADSSSSARKVEIEVDADVYKKLQGTPYEGKAKVMAATYKRLAPKYGVNFAIGMLGNVNGEGTYGLVEYSFSKRHAYGFSLPSGGFVIKSAEDATYAKNWDSVTHTGDPQKGSCGVGSVQWSFDRRVLLCEKYLSNCSTYSDEELSMVEHLYMEDELAGSESGAVTACNGLSAGDCAYTICTVYERPDAKEARGAERKAYAEDIERILAE